MRPIFGERLAGQWLAAALLGVLPGLPALAAPPPGQSGGTLLQQAQPAPVPAASPNDNGLHIEQPGSAPLPLSEPFLVARIDIGGNTRVATAKLHELIAAAEGQRLTLSQLAAVIQRLTDYYHEQGYLLARAIVPAQTIHAGVVRVEIIEARYDKVSVSNRTRVDTGLLAATVADLDSGSVVSQGPLDRSLLLLADIPGVKVNASLRPGASVGSSDLQVDLAPAPVVTGSAVADDYGDPYSGRFRLGATVNVLDPLGHGDELAFAALTSGSGMNYGRMSYDTLLNGEGARVGAGYSGLHYRLSGEFAALDAYGTAQDGMLWARQPLLRSRISNAYVQLQYDHLQLNDDVGASDVENRRHLDTLTSSFSGDIRDNSLAGAVSTWSGSWTYGHVGFDNAAAESADASAADTQGDFSRWNLILGRLQSFTVQDALYVGAAAQCSKGNLDPSQKLVVGGPGSVRAYDVSALSGDTGYQLTAELRHTFPQLHHGQWQMVAFLDNAYVTVNRTQFAPGRNIANLSDAGAGVNWTGADQWSFSVVLATPIGNEPVLAGDTTSTHLWLQVTRGF
jgi:hemolysin activation/secretion protein